MLQLDYMRSFAKNMSSHGEIVSMTQDRIGLLFVVLSLLFFALSLRDYIRSKGATTPARRAWLRIAIIFAIVGTLLYLRVLG